VPPAVTQPRPIGALPTREPATGAASGTATRGSLLLLPLAAATSMDPAEIGSTKLTVANFEGEVKKNIDAGNTFFVRWIASAG